MSARARSRVFRDISIVNLGDIVLRPTDLQNDHTSLRVEMVRHRGIFTLVLPGLQVKAGVGPDFGFHFHIWDTSNGHLWVRIRASSECQLLGT